MWNMEKACPIALFFVLYIYIHRKQIKMGGEEVEREYKQWVWVAKFCFTKDGRMFECLWKEFTGKNSWWCINGSKSNLDMISGVVSRGESVCDWARR